MRSSLSKQLIFGCMFAFISGCGTNPSSLKAPEQLTCVHLSEALDFYALYGLFDVKWTTRLERGPYWSEKRDKNGTYYRAPAGGLVIAPIQEGGYAGQTIFNGGFYVPDNPNKPIAIYKYFGLPSDQVRVPEPDENCNSIVFDGIPDEKNIPRVNSGGVIISALVNAEIGQIMFEPEIKDKKIMESLRKAFSERVVISKARN